MKRTFLIVVALLALTFAYSQNIDSVAVSRGGLPVVYKNDTLFYVYSKIGPYKPVDRVNTILRRINTLITDSDFAPDSLYISESEQSTDIWFQDRVVFSVTDLDAKAEDVTRTKLAERDLSALKNALNLELKSMSLKSILLQAGLTLLELLIIYLLIRYINKLFRWTKKWLIDARGRILKGIKFKGYEFLDTERELKVALV
ncbi:MAG: hypothetical protein RIA63_04190, partial [Cyclobacteriaceae bacterium]